MYYKELNVTGVVNVTTLDEGLPSLVKEPTRIIAILINLSAYEGNVIEGWIATERILAIYDYIFDTQDETAGATAPYSATKISRVELNMDIPPGQLFKVGVRCGATANNIFGAYEYQKIQ